MLLPPKYTKIELQSALEIDAELPEGIKEEDFLRDIKDNTRVKWRVNGFLFKEKLLLLLLDITTFRKWKIFKSLNWLLVFAIIGFAIWAGDYKILLFLIFYPILIIPFDHWIFIFNMTVIIGAKLLFKFSIPYFWFFVAIITIGYLLNKAIYEMVEKKILKFALNDWITFWKYYSNKLIWMDKTAFNKEYQILTDKYPELRTQL